MSFRASQGLEDVHLVMQNPLLLHGAKIARAPQSETNRTWREAKAKLSSLNRSGGLKMPYLPHACLSEVSSAFPLGRSRISHGGCMREIVVNCVTTALRAYIGSRFTLRRQDVIPRNVFLWPPTTIGSGLGCHS